MAHGPVRVLGGESFQQGLQGALAVPHGVGVGGPGGGEGAVGRQVFGAFHPAALWVQQDDELIQDVQVVQNRAQRHRLHWTLESV